MTTEAALCAGPGRLPKAAAALTPSVLSVPTEAVSNARRRPNPGVLGGSGRGLRSSG